MTTKPVVEQNLWRDWPLFAGGSTEARRGPLAAVSWSVAREGYESNEKLAARLARDIGPVLFERLPLRDTSKAVIMAQPSPRDVTPVGQWKGFWRSNAAPTGVQSGLQLDLGTETVARWVGLWRLDRLSFAHAVDYNRRVETSFLVVVRGTVVMDLAWLRHVAQAAFPDADARKPDWAGLAALVQSDGIVVGRAFGRFDDPSFYFDLFTDPGTAGAIAAVGGVDHLESD